MRKQDLLGRWALRQWTQAYDDGRVTHPMGQAPRGFIQYDDDRMFCMIERTDRQVFATGGQWNASAEEKARAYESFMSYAGTYDLAGDEVRQHVDMSLFPNWEGGVQRRKAAIVDGLLHLSARLEDGTPEARTASLVWERAGRAITS